MSDLVLEIPFIGGIDEAAREELVDAATSFTALSNTRQGQRGGVEKRLGYNASTSREHYDASTARSQGRRMFVHKGAINVIDGSLIDSYLETLDLNVPRGRVPEAAYRLSDIPSPSATAYVCDVEYASGYVVVAYGSAAFGPVSTCVIELATGVVARGPVDATPFDGVIRGMGSGVIRLASYGDRYVIAFVQVASTTAIESYIIDLSNGGAAGWSALATVAATSASSGAAGPISVCSLSSRVAVAYGTTSGASRVVVKTYTAAGLTETATITAGSTPTQVDVAGSIAGMLWVAWNQGTNVYACALDADALAVVLGTATTVPITTTFGLVPVIHLCEDALLSTSTAGLARILVYDGGIDGCKMSNVTAVAGVASFSSATIETTRNLIPIGRSFHQGGRYYIAAKAPDNDHCIVVDWTETIDINGDINAYVRPIANIEPELVTLASGAVKCPATTSGKRVFGINTAKSGGVGDTTITSGAALVELDFAARSRWQPIEHAGSTFLSGAILSVYDGDRVTEAGFLVRPSAPNPVPSGTGITGTFRYVAIYEDVDASGNWVVSSISDPSDAIVVVNKTIDVDVSALTISSRLAKGTVRIALYRTGGVLGEVPYYRVSTVDNDTSAAAVSFADALDPDVLATHGKLYAPNLPSTAGESFDRRAPPGLTRLESYNGMLVGAKDSTLFYSGQEVYGEAVWFSPVFQVPVPGKGAITALRSQDGTLYVFKRDGIWAVSGEAPSDNGASGGLGTPRRLACDVGCVEPMSVVVTELGIFFQSARGIELLNRSGSITYVGQPVMLTIDMYPVVTSAVLDDVNSLVRFALAAAESSGRVTGAGRDLVFDLTTKSWVSTDIKSATIQGNPSTQVPSQDACVVYYGGAWRYAWLGYAGEVFVERLSSDEDAHLDNATWVTQSATTSWVHIAGIQGEQFIDQVLLLAKQSTAHDVTIALAYDYSDTFTSTKTFTAATLATLAREWLVKEVTQTTSNAVRVMVEDATPSSGTVGSGKGGTWVCLTATGQPHRGPKRSSSAQRGT